MYSLEGITDEIDLAKVEAHLLVCNVCQDKLLAADRAYTATMQAALSRLDLVPVAIHAVHETDEGSVYLWVSEFHDDCCVARIQGCQVDSGQVLDSFVEAVRQNNIRFQTLFSEHVCSGECVRHENETLRQL